MSKVLTIITAFLCSILLIGCTNCSKNNSSMFVLVERNGDYDVVYNSETKVMYVITYGIYHVGNFTLLVNPDGTPMLYEGGNK